MNGQPALKPLHADAALIRTKLDVFARWTSEQLLDSLRPDGERCLKCRPDGTMLDGHHRIFVLRGRAVTMWTSCRERESFLPWSRTDAISWVWVARCGR